MNRALKFRRRLGLAGIGIGMILFMAFYYAFRSAEESTDLERWVAHTQEVRGVIADARMERLRLTDEVWAYRSAHNPDLITRFHDELRGLREDLARLRMLTADNPAQQGLVAELTLILGDQLHDLESAMQRAEVSPARSFRSSFDWSFPTLPSERLRQIFVELDSNERALLAQRSAAVVVNARHTRTVLLFAAYLTFVILVLAGYFIQREIMLRAKIEAGMRQAHELLGGKYEEKRAQLGNAVEDLHAEIRARRRAEDEIRLLNTNLEERVEQRTKELRETNRELEAFTYAVSHDLRAPLRHLDGFSRILQQGCSEHLSKEALHYLDRIRSAAAHMSALLEDLLRLSHIGRQLPDRRLLSLNSLVAKAREEALSDAGDRAIQWQIAALPEVEADPVLLHQVFANLFSNAVKFTRQQIHPVIEVGYRPESGETIIFVRDNGAGFDPKYADKLFGVFQRLHRQDEFEGTGIGLATVQRIVHKHGGRVWAESQPGLGATFYFTVPAGPQGRSQTRDVIGATV